MSTFDPKTRLATRLAERNAAAEQAEDSSELLDSRRVCPYGFQRPEDFDYQTYNRFLREYMPVMMRRKRKWDSLLKHSRGVPSAGRKLKRYVRKGIPREFRADVWLSVSGAQKKMVERPNHYREMLRKQNDPDVLQRIDLDILRTFPENVHFQEGAKEMQVIPLRNVLVAFANHNETIGYCQGINFIAGMLLLVTENEEHSFWLLDSLLGNRVQSAYYTSGMTGLQTDQFVLRTLLLRRAPRLVQHLDQLKIDIQVVTVRWFVCLFIDALPVETLLRVWDCLFLEGDKILFRVAMALMIHHEETLLSKSTFIDAIETLKTTTNSFYVLDCHHFVHDIYTILGSFSRRQIVKGRAAYQSQSDRSQS